ncbi:hypothetical protein EV294_102733 [Paenibacillus sp. BK033]|nr:hypothetical protein EV294_102733 [Paenibacillus sp. BK033]
MAGRCCDMIELSFIDSLTISPYECTFKRPVNPKFPISRSSTKIQVLKIGGSLTYFRYLFYFIYSF